MPQYDSDCPMLGAYNFLNPKFFPLSVGFLNGVAKSNFCAQAGRTYSSVPGYTIGTLG